MNTQQTRRALLGALAAAGILLAASAVPAPARADSRPVMALNGWNGQLGPGIGSVKSPFGVLEVGSPLGRPSNNTLNFDTTTGQAAPQAPVTYEGPGPWSVKSPGNDWYPGGAF